MRTSTSLARLFGAAAIMIGALATAACGGAPPSQQAAAVQGQAVENPAAKPSGQQTNAAQPPANTAPDKGGNKEISPSEVAAGNVTLVMALQPARHMYDLEMTTSAVPVQQPPDQQQSQSAAPQKGSAVLGGKMIDAANNIDPSQSPPADSAESIMRHVMVQVKDKSGETIPYLELTMDVLLDGRPTLFDQALIPMTAADGNSSELYYGNNVKFPRKGDYQIFIRMVKNPLLGQDQTPAAQFNLSLR